MLSPSSASTAGSTTSSSANVTDETNDNDSTAQTREQNRQDSKDSGNTAIGEYEIVWVHENFMRVDGDEMVFYTLGTEFMLTDAKPLAEVYFTGERPLLIGCCVVETHKVMPERPVVIGDGSWLGHGTVVLPGATIGRHVVVGANSVVTGHLPDNCVAAGVPAKVLRQL